MIRQLLEEVKAAPLDEASRTRLKEIHQASIKELEAGLAPELVEELERLSLPFTEDATPSDSELRIAQAQLVGWLEGLFHGIQTAIYAQQMAARAQFEQIRRALPPGMPRMPGRPARARRAEDGRQPERPGESGRDVPLGRQPPAERDRGGRRPGRAGRRSPARHPGRPAGRGSVRLAHRPTVGDGRRLRGSGGGGAGAGVPARRASCSTLRTSALGVAGAGAAAPVGR